VEAVILAGGLGTRLYPLTLTRPKSLLPFLDQPIIEYQLALAREAGCSTAIAAAGHLSSSLQKYCPQHGPKLSLVREEEPLGTGGAVAQALRVSGVEPPVMVVNGDIVTDLAPRSLWSTHEGLGGWITLTAADVKAPENYGTLRFDETGVLAAFAEKAPAGENRQTTPVNAGVYLLGPAACTELKSRQGAFSLEHDFFPELASRGVIRVHRHAGFWRDVGTLDSYFKSQFDVLGYFLTMGIENLLGGRDDYSLFRDFIYIHRDAVLGDSCDLFHRVVLMRRAVVGDGCYLRNCIVLPGATIGCNCRLETVIIDAGTVVDAGTNASFQVISGSRREPFAG